MSKYAVIQKPYHPTRFTIYFVYASDFIAAISRFKTWKEYNRKNKYAIFDIEDYDDREEYSHITDIY